MPTYLYQCQINNEEFEEFHSITTELEECLVCKEKGLEQHKPKRLISGGSGRGIMNDGDDYVNKVKADAQRVKKEIYSSDKAYASVLGESKYHDIQTRLDRRGK